MCYSIIDQWRAAKCELERAKEAEVALREEIVRGCFYDRGNPLCEGVNKTKLPDGSLVKVTYRLNRKVDLGQYSALRPVLGEDLFFRVFNHTPSISIRTFNTLDVDTQNKINAVLVVTPGSATMEIVHDGD